MMTFDVPICDCYGCGFAGPAGDATRREHAETRNLAAALSDNAETDRQLFAMGLPSRTTDCKESPFCVIKTRPGQQHDGECMNRDKFESVEYSLVRR